MRKTAALFAIAALFGSAGLATLAAHGAVVAFETLTEDQVVDALHDVDSNWTTVTVDGLIVNLYGRAPSERARFAVLEALSDAFSGGRIRDQSALAGEDDRSVPNFSVEILRNGVSVSLIGQAPKEAAAQIAYKGLTGIDALDVTDMLELREFDVPDGWSDSLMFASQAVQLFEHGNAVVSPGHVRLFAVMSTAEEAEAFERRAKELKPASVELVIATDTPLPTIAPFEFALSVNGEVGQLTRCSVPSQAEADQLQEALSPWGLSTENCKIGLGAPGPSWTDVVITALASLEQIGGGTLVVENADLHLTALPGADQPAFDAACETLSAALPDLYTLHSKVPPEPQPEEIAEVAPPLLVATRGDDGQVRLRGDLTDAMLSDAAQAIAQAHFGFDAVAADTQARDDLPIGWSARVLAGIEALALLNVGEASITENGVRVTGEAQTEDVEPALRMLLGARLGGLGNIQTSITVNPREEEPAISEQRAELCEQQVAGLLLNSQIQFPPGATEIDQASGGIVDRIAQILQDCPGARFEIGGHTDAQGRESSNQAISQARAAKVLDALLERNVDKVFLIAKGYGETLPVADNETEEGRAANRRIEFRLVREGEAEAAEVMLAGDEDGEDVSTTEEQTTEAATNEATETSGQNPAPAAAASGAESAFEQADSTGEQPVADAEDQSQGTAPSEAAPMRPRPRDLSE